MTVSTDTAANALPCPTLAQLEEKSAPEERNLFRQVDAVAETQDISLSFLDTLLHLPKGKAVQYLHAKARACTEQVYGDRIFLRALIEISSYCKNNCRYCGIRRGNTDLTRYRMDEDTIAACCADGYAHGMRTFVLQSGEDAWWTDRRLCRLVERLHLQFPDCAITLSLGERSRESYQQLFDAGASRYLLRHETADAAHYALLHPAEMSYAHRMQCLKDLKEIGFQVGCGFMVGSPGQSPQTLWKDLQFIRTFQPHMVGIGPFVATQQTPFAAAPNGSVEDCLRLLSIIRIMHPHVLLPATTALGSLHPFGRELGVLAGANVLMPNVSPVENREKYHIYDNKICLDDGVDHCVSCLERRLQSVGRRMVVDRGDFRA